MKNKILGVIMVAAIAVAAGWNVYQSENKVTLSDLGLENVEALASSESDPDADCIWSPGDTCTYPVATPHGNYIESKTEHRPNL